MTQEFLTANTEETERLGAAFAKQLHAGDAVAFFGGLGAGKTAFVRGLAAGLGCEGEVSSPTYALVHEHAGPVPLAHFDMYRVEGPDELESTGFYDYLDREFVLAIEWSEHILEALPEDCWRVCIEATQEDCRRISITRGAVQA